MPAQIIKEVMREYEKDRDKAAALAKSRLERIYEEIPRLREIDLELSNLGLTASKSILGLTPGGETPEQLIARLARDNQRLTDEKNSLFKRAGYGGYLSDVYKCGACKDTGFVGGEKCACFKRRLISKFYEMSNLSKILKKENFETFNIEYYSNEVNPKTGVSPRANMNRILAAAQNFVKNFDTDYNNLLMYGSTGLGKTFLCNCIAKELLDSGKAVLYVTSPQLFKLVEAVRFNKTEDEEPEQFMEMIFSADLLIIDDLGTEIPTIVTASELFNIINTRILNKRHMIISTNFSPEEFADIYSDRITSRLFGNYMFLKFIGDDIRVKSRYKM